MSLEETHLAFRIKLKPSSRKREGKIDRERETARERERDRLPVRQ